MSKYIKKQDEVDWSKVKIDIPILVSKDGETWFKRYFAQYTDNKVYAWSNGCTSWSCDEEGYKMVNWKYAKLADIEDKHTIKRK